MISTDLASVQGPFGRRARHGFVLRGDAEEALERLGVDAYANALAESVIGLFKTEVIRRKGPWRSLEATEFATLAWMEWFNTRRLLGAIGTSRAEFEAQYYAQASVASFNKLGRPTIPVSLLRRPRPMSGL